MNLFNRVKLPFSLYQAESITAAGKYEIVPYTGPGQMEAEYRRTVFLCSSPFFQLCELKSVQ